MRNQSCKQRRGHTCEGELSRQVSQVEHKSYLDHGLWICEADVCEGHNIVVEVILEKEGWEEPVVCCDVVSIGLPMD